MKRITILILAIIMGLSLVACGSNTSGNTEDSGVKEIPLDKEVILVDN